jgi:uncharacterized membrane protein
MLIKFEKYPITVFFCFLWSILGFLLIFLNTDEIPRIIISIPLIIYIPGYVMIYALFPNNSIRKMERIILNAVASLVIVSLIGLILNFTTWGIRLLPILSCLEIFIFCIGSIAIIRWMRTPSEKRYNLMIHITLPKNQSKLNKTLTILLTISIITVTCILLYVILTPKLGEKFTEFYILDSNNRTDNYPTNLTIGENATVNIGIVNHEYKTINYTVEIWLSNQTEEYNYTSQKNETIYNNLWFLDTITITLDHQPINLEERRLLQWEYHYAFNISEKGTFKLTFLLYTSPTIGYFKNYDYKMIAQQKISSENTTAYRTTHLWITVK